MERRHERPADEGVSDEERWQPERWIDEGPEIPAARPPRSRAARPQRSERAAAAARGRPGPAPQAKAAPAARSAVKPTRPPDRSTNRKRQVPDELAAELAQAGGARRAPRLVGDLAAAAQAYEAGRYPEAQKLLRPLAETAPGAAGVRELYGLTLYRMGRWRVAKAELEAFRELTGSVDQEPVVADCERALGMHAAVARRWEALRQASPSAEVLAEGRLVMAGSLADRGDLTGAIALLQRYQGDRARPKPWQLRTWYALADLYERAGDVPRARELFGRLVARERDFFDAAERLAALR